MVALVLLGWVFAGLGAYEMAKCLILSVRKRHLPTEVPGYLYAALTHCLSVGAGLGISRTELSWFPLALLCVGLPLFLTRMACELTYIPTLVTNAREYPRIRVKFCRYQQKMLVVGALATVGVEVTAVIIADSYQMLPTSSMLQFGQWTVAVSVAASAAAYGLREVEKRLWAGGLLRRHGSEWFGNYTEARMRVDKLHFSH